MSTFKIISEIARNGPLVNHVKVCVKLINFFLWKCMPLHEIFHKIILKIEKTEDFFQPNNLLHKYGLSEVCEVLPSSAGKWVMSIVLDSPDERDGWVFRMKARRLAQHQWLIAVSSFRSLYICQRILRLTHNISLKIGLKVVRNSIHYVFQGFSSASISQYFSVIKLKSLQSIVSKLWSANVITFFQTMDVLLDSVRETGLALNLSREVPHQIHAALFDVAPLFHIVYLSFDIVIILKLESKIFRLGLLVETVLIFTINFDTNQPKQFVAKKLKGVKFLNCALLFINLFGEFNGKVSFSKKKVTPPGFLNVFFLIEETCIWLNPIQSFGKNCGKSPKKENYNTPQKGRFIKFTLKYIKPLCLNFLKMW
ncbi:hypothetical protein VP01_3966g1 [Puccinia sorghi]|uniref:Uncharacterized protein n=1 Tax=Puccinia sorghi TaxID=27349 RepID=A0A0L6UU92_9BASI|nr:hypothetical protein VP01_3966g1 [Puccinia sorghi]